MQPGETISHYTLLGRIGRDHDTIIYRARDVTLDRDVAIKLLSPEHAASATARDRFRREAHIASRVSHPNICAVHDSGEENGRAFLVCELLEGQALDELLKAGPLPPSLMLDLAVQLVDAVAAVHRRGIVHGNIKPSNVFVTGESHVKLLELGLMSAWWETQAQQASPDGSSPTASSDQRAPADRDVAGYHSYRSPEHVAGERLDHRSDIFSIGAVLYEMASQERAFPGETPSRIAAAIVASPPAPATRSGTSLASIDSIVQKALEKSPDDRYQSAADLLADLRRARRRSESSSAGLPTAGVARGSRWRKAVAVSAAALVLSTAAGWWWWRGRSVAPVERHALLIGSVANGTNDPDFEGTLRQALTVHLGQSPFLDIVSDERIREILENMRRDPAAPLTHDVAREACRRLKAGALIDGSVSAVGSATVVALVASDCESGNTIWRQQAEVARKEDVLRAVGTIASEMRRSLGESVKSLEGYNVPIEEATTPSLEALKAFTAGNAKRAASLEIESIPFFERALQLDPNFAQAYATLSSIYGNLGETGRADDYASKAFEHRNNVSERERLFITYQYHDRVTGDQLKAQEALEIWKQSYPLDSRPGNAMAVLLNRLGEYDRAITEAQQAMNLDPARPFPYSNLAYAYRGAGRYPEARRIAQRAVDMKIATIPTRRLLYQLAEMDGDTAAAQLQLDWASTSSRGFDLPGAQAQIAAFRGRMTEARRLYQKTIDDAVAGRLAQVGSGYSVQLALTDALYGYPALAIERAGRIPMDGTYEPQLRAATALAVAGAVAESEKWTNRLREFRPADTLLHAAYLPVADAAALLARNRPAEAIDALRPAAPYERGGVAALWPIYFRAEARRRSGAFDEASREFRVLISSRGADPFSPAIPLAHLGLARARAQAGDAEGSRAAYAQLFEIWKNADPDLPVLVQARAELAALPR